MKVRENTMKNGVKLKWMIISAVALVATGICLVMMGLWMPPIGEIHPSVLTALGEILTFSGALFGINASYRYKTFINEHDENYSSNDRKNNK